uniref:Uncharacterized protein n=1 Tax=Ditylenchus dipsaci TaxID=166011 RepID=A0A915DWM1_9BILA
MGTCGEGILDGRKVQCKAACAKVHVVPTPAIILSTCFNTAKSNSFGPRSLTCPGTVSLPSRSLTCPSTANPPRSLACSGIVNIGHRSLTCFGTVNLAPSLITSSIKSSCGENSPSCTERNVQSTSALLTIQKKNPVAIVEPVQSFGSALSSEIRCSSTTDIKVQAEEEPVLSSVSVASIPTSPGRMTYVNSVLQVDAGERSVPSKTVMSHYPGASCLETSSTISLRTAETSSYDRSSTSKSSKLWCEESSMWSRDSDVREKSELVGMLNVMLVPNNFGKKGSRSSRDQDLVIETPRESSSGDSVSLSPVKVKSRKLASDTNSARVRTRSRANSSHKPDNTVMGLFLSKDINNAHQT